MTARPSLIAFRLFGVRLRVDPTWLILALLVAWSLAYGVFPQLYEGLPVAAYWLMALIAVIGLSLSIIIHEFAHTLVGRAFGMPINQISLFLFGGAAELEEEPDSPKTELLMAIAGPVVSAILGALLLWLAALMGGAAEAETPGPPLAAVVHYLGLLNIVLAVFNMLPAFPLDGGRVFRAILWMAGGDRYAATRTATRAGRVFAVLLMALGGLAALSGALVAGLWWVLIGTFLFGASGAAWRDVQARRFLAGVKVSELMVADVDAAGAEMSVADFVERLLYPRHHRLFPVLDGERVIGVVSEAQVKKLPRQTWAATPVRAIMAAPSLVGSAAPDDDAATALTRLARSPYGGLLVTDNGRLAGLLTFKDVSDYLRVRTLLEG